MKLNRPNIAKILSLSFILMGIIHIVATFTPLIANKISLLPNSTQGIFIYFSLMCGALLMLSGGIIYTLAEKGLEHPFLRKPYMLTLAFLVANAVLAVVLMPHNPFAWVIFVLTTLLLFANIAIGRDNK